MSRTGNFTSHRAAAAHRAGATHRASATHRGSQAYPALLPGACQASPPLETLAAQLGGGATLAYHDGPCVYDGVRFVYSFSFATGIGTRIDTWAASDLNFLAGSAKCITLSNAAKAKTGEGTSVGVFNITYDPQNHILYGGGCGLPSQSTHGYAWQHQLGDPTNRANDANWTDSTKVTIFDTSALADVALTYSPVWDPTSQCLYCVPTQGASVTSDAFNIWDPSQGAFNSFGAWSSNALETVLGSSNPQGFQYGILVPGVALVMPPYYNDTLGNFSGYALAYDITKGRSGAVSPANYYAANLANIFDTNTRGFTGGHWNSPYLYLNQFQIGAVNNFNGKYICRCNLGASIGNFSSSGLWQRADTSQQSTYVLRASSPPVNGGAYQASCTDGVFDYFVGNVSSYVARFRSQGIPGEFAGILPQSWDGLDTALVANTNALRASYGGCVVANDGWIYCSPYGYTGSGDYHSTWLRIPSARMAVMN